MIWLQLLGIGRYILSAIRAGIKWALSDWRHAVIAVLALAVAYFHLSAAKWQGRAEKALAAVEKRDQRIAAMQLAGINATLAQIAMNAARTKAENDNARKSDDAYKLAQAGGNAAAIRYIDRWKVRGGSCPGTTNPAASSESAGIPETMPTGAVLVSEGDVLACTGATAYAIEAHNDAMRRIEAGIAE